jgi:magnesium-transporting ATPase (P-type)
MRETYTNQESASSATSSHETNCAQPPVVLQDLPEDEDEPPIRPPDKQPQQPNKDQYDLTQHFDNIDLESCLPTEDGAWTGGSLLVEKRPFNRHASDLAEDLHTSLTFGLDDVEAQRRLKHYGKNLLKGHGTVSLWSVLWRQVSNAMTIILLGALAIAFATLDFAEGAVIAGILFLVPEYL